MTKGLILALMFAAAPAKADTTLPRLGVVQISTGSLNWGPKYNASMGLIDAGVAAQGVTNTFVASNTFTAATLFSFGYLNVGCVSVGALRVATPSIHTASQRTLVVQCDDMDVYTSTAPSIGSWRNTRTGTGP